MESLRVMADDGAALHVAAAGSGRDVLVLSGGPGCVHYLADEALFPTGLLWWFPDPRGVGASGGGGMSGRCGASVQLKAGTPLRRFRHDARTGRRLRDCRPAGHKPADLTGRTRTTMPAVVPCMA